MVRAYINTVEALIILGLVAMVAITFTSTMMRQIPGFGGLYWGEEVTRYLSVWVVFLGAGLGVRFGIHLHFDLLVASLPPAPARILVVGSLLLMLAFEAVLVWFGAKMTIINHAQQSASLRLPMSFAYAAIPVGAAIMLGETVRLLVREVRGAPRQAPLLVAD